MNRENEILRSCISTKSNNKGVAGSVRSVRFFDLVDKSISRKQNNEISMTIYDSSLFDDDYNDDDEYSRYTIALSGNNSSSDSSSTTNISGGNHNKKRDYSSLSFGSDENNSRIWSSASTIAEESISEIIKSSGVGGGNFEGRWLPMVSTTENQFSLSDSFLTTPNDNGPRKNDTTKNINNNTTFTKRKEESKKVDVAVLQRHTQPSKEKFVALKDEEKAACFTTDVVTSDFGRRFISLSRRNSSSLDLRPSLPVRRRSDESVSDMIGDIYSNLLIRNEAKLKFGPTAMEYNN